MLYDTTSPLYHAIVHGPILDSVINDIRQLDPQDAADIAASLVDYYSSIGLGTAKSFPNSQAMTFQCITAL